MHTWYIQTYYMCRAPYYYDREQHLRRDDHRQQGRVGREGMVRYGHQGGGQRQAGQGTVT